MMSALLVASAALVQSPAPAADAAEPAATDRIIVTGERVRRSLRETPSSVFVATQGLIEDQAAYDRLDQLLELAPNIQVTAGNLGPTIRGQDSTGTLQDLPAFLGGNRPRATLQVDGRAASHNEFIYGTAPLWDVAQVEVFRTPQTTTQGRNAIAGAIHVATNDPTYAWEAAGRAIYGDLGTRHGSALLSGPIVSDQLAFRLSADVRKSRPSARIADTTVGGNPEREDSSVVRAKLLAEPGLLPGLKLVAGYSRNRNYGPQASTIRAPFEQRSNPAPTIGIFSVKVDSLTVRADQQVGGRLELTAIGSVGDAWAQRFAPSLLGETITKSHDYSLETVVHWRAHDWLTLHGGMHWLANDMGQQIKLFAFNGTATFDDRQRSFGIFGQAEVRPAPGLLLTAGLRRQRDSQARFGKRENDGSEIIRFDEQFSAWLPKLSLSYDASPDLTVGLLAQRAYNPGGATLNFETGGPELLETEYLTTIELFARAGLLGGRLQLRANLFLNRFQDAQRAQSRAYTIPGVGTAFWSEFLSVEKATSRGIEVEAVWRAGDHLSLRGGLGLLDSEFDKPGAGLAALDGKEFQRAPAFTGNASVDWRPLPPLRLNASIRHYSSYFSDDQNSLDRRIAGGTTIDGKLSYERGAMTAFAYGRNLLDRFNLTYLYSPTLGTAADPREIGAGLEFRF